MLKLHLDTDLGGNIDDLCALAMVLNWPEVELLALTTVAEHRGKRAGYVKYALELAGREGVPVSAGADASLGCYRDWPGLPDEDVYWPEPMPSAPNPLDQTLDLLERSIEEGAIIAAIGPLYESGFVRKAVSRHIARREALSHGRLCVPSEERFPALGQPDGLQRPG